MLPVYWVCCKQHHDSNMDGGGDREDRTDDWHHETLVKNDKTMGK